jgi:hypothetical protein
VGFSGFYGYLDITILLAVLIGILVFRQDMGEKKKLIDIGFFIWFSWIRNGLFSRDLDI